MILLSSNALSRASARLLVPPLVVTTLALGVLAGIKLLKPRTSGRSANIVAAGSILTVKLEHTLSSQSERAGDEFKAHVVALQTSDGRSVRIDGAWVTGRCVAVRAKQGRGRPGYMRLALADLHDSKGRVSSLITTAVSQWGSQDDHQHGSGPVGPRPITDPARLQAAAQSSAAGDAEFTRETPISFVLLEPMVVSR